MFPTALARRALGDPGLPHRAIHRPLHDRLVQVMPPALPGHGFDICPRRREHPLPRPLPPGVRIPPRERVGRLHPTLAPSARRSAGRGAHRARRRAAAVGAAPADRLRRRPTAAPPGRSSTPPPTSPACRGTIGPLARARQYSWARNAAACPRWLGARAKPTSGPRTPTPAASAWAAACGSRG